MKKTSLGLVCLLLTAFTHQGFAEKPGSDDSARSVSLQKAPYFYDCEIQLSSGKNHSAKILARIREGIDEHALTLTLVHNLRGVHRLQLNDDRGATLFEAESGSPAHMHIPASQKLLAALKTGRLRITLDGGHHTGSFTARPKNDEHRMRYVTIKNLTRDQTFSPPVVVSHHRDFQLFGEGDEASPGLSVLAREGSTTELVDELLTAPNVIDVVVVPKVIYPGKSITVAIAAGVNHRVSVAGMLISTNDGFFAVRGMDVPGRLGAAISDSNKVYAAVYDAGVETNTEVSEHIPGQGGAGVDVVDGAEGTVEHHPGLSGHADLERRRYAWGNFAAEVFMGPDRTGSMVIPLSLDLNPTSEIVIQEPSMCEGGAEATVTWSRADNKVVIEVVYVGLPTELSLAFPQDPSTPYHRFPQEISGGIWQTWIIGFFGGKNITIYYDATSGEIMGTQWDFPDGPPENAIAVPAGGGHALCSPLWAADESGTTHVRFVLDYDSMLDGRDTGGMIITAAPYQLGDANTRGPFFSAGLPVSESFSFDDMLDNDTWNTGFAIGTSYEPVVKPDYLLSRANIMTTWTGSSVNRNLPVAHPDPCETFLTDPWPFEDRDN